MDVVVQIPAYQEGRQLTETAEQIVAQPTPDAYTVDVETWVTLSPPDRSLCDTWQAGMAARSVDTFEAPQGKLSARNAAHDNAVERGYDVIVTWDADAPPLRQNTLAQLLAPFGDDAVVAVNSKPVTAIELSFVDRAVDVVGAVEDRLKPHMHGQCSAFTAGVWSEVGSFDTSIDESDENEVRPVEEFGFYKELSQYGEIVYANNAMVYNNPRRLHCTLPFMGDPTFCERREGNTTFSPDRR